MALPTPADVVAAEAAVGGGKSLPTPERVAAAEAAVRDAAGFGGGALALAERFASNITFGMSDVASGALQGALTPDIPRAAGPGIDAPLDDQSSFSRGMEQAQLEADARAEAHPVAAGVGGVLGVAAPALLTGGASLGARALAATPAALAGAGARRFAAGVAAKLGGGTAGTIAGAVVAGATEAGIAAGATRLAKGALAGEFDPGELAERVLVATGAGAVGGLLLGAGGAGARALGRGARSVADDLFKPLERLRTKRIAEAEAAAYQATYGGAAGGAASGPAGGDDGLAGKAADWLGRRAVGAGMAAVGVPRVAREMLGGFGEDAAAKVIKPMVADGLEALSTLAARKGAILDEAARGAGELSKLAGNAVRTALSTGARAAGIAIGSADKGLYEAAVKHAADLSDPASEASSDLKERASALDQLVPGLGFSYAEAAQRRAEWVRSKIPQAPGQDAVYAGAAAADPVTMRANIRAVEAAYAPVLALRRVSAGVATVGEIEAVKTLAPRVWADYTTQVAQRLLESGKKPTRAERRKLAAMTGLVLDPSDSTEALIRAQQAPVASEDEQQGGGGEPKRTRGKFGMEARDVFATQADRITTNLQ